MRDMKLRLLPVAGSSDAGSRVLEQADQSGGALHVAVELRQELVAGKARRQRFGIEIGRDQGESVMMISRAGRRAGAGVGGHARSALAADELVRRLAGFAFGE